MTETKSTTQSPLSLAQAKELIEFARKHRVIACNFAGLSFQFSPGAFEDDEPTKPKKPPDGEVESPFGHFKPEE